MSDLKWKTLSSEYIHKDEWLTARKDRCEMPNGTIVDPYYVLEYADWVTVLPVTAEGKVILVQQYRQALGEVSIELPGGCVEQSDASLEDAARRETLEETGYSFETMHYLGKISANPSTNANLMHMFVATGGRKVQEQHLDPNEELELLEVSWEEFIQLVEEKRIIQAMHMSTIFYALRYLDKVSYK
ncbi:MAG: NUDIX hydrolase [Filimonas sp.]|nr:NUDIX hydrolase [Filimonas sp.]